MSEAQKRYLKKNYGVLSVRVRKEKLLKFKAVCREINRSQSSVVNRAIDDFLIIVEVKQ